MTKRTILCLPLLASLSLACSDDATPVSEGTGTETGTETGDGDGDATTTTTTTGDGDGDMTGDGDGDPATGDGDGDMTTTGDGDGDMTTTGDGDGDMTTGDGDGDMTTGDGDGDPMPLPGGELRVFHGSPDAPPVDIYIEGVDDPVVVNLAFAQTTGFLPVPEGEYNFQVYVNGAEPIPDNLVIETGPVMIDVDVNYTVLARGLLGAEDDQGPFGLDLFVEEFDEVAPDTVRARIVHAAADAPAVDIDIYDANNEGACAGDIEIADFELFSETGAAGVELPAVDGLNVAVCVGDQLVRPFTLDLAALDGAELFVFADGVLSQNIGRELDSFQLFAIGPDTVGDSLVLARDPYFYVMHAVPDVGRVDVCINGNPIGALQNVDYGDLVGPFRIARNLSYNFALHPDAGGQQCAGPGVPYPIDGADMIAGTTNVVAVAGSLGLDNLSQEIFAEGLELDDADSLRIQAIHLSPDTPEVDVGAEGVGFGVWTDLVYPNGSDPAGAALVPGAYTVQAGVSMAMGEDADAAAVSFGPIDLSDAAGLRAMGFVTGLLAPPPNAESLALFIVVTSENGDFGWQLLPIPAN